MNKNGKKVRISSESVNSYGFRVLTSGIDVAQYEKNPVLLYMHKRGEVIGHVEGLEKQGGCLTGTLVFDEASELSRRCKAQFEAGSLRMVSAGLMIRETSDDAGSLLPGQTRPTVTACRLFEVSVVDVGANDDATVLYAGEGERIRLDAGEGCPLPILNNNPKQKNQEMDIKTTALALGLPETATEQEVLAALQKNKEEQAALHAELESLKASAIEGIVGRAVTDRKIGADRRGQFVALGKKIGAEELGKVFDAMAPQVRLSAVISQGGAGAPYGSYTKLSEVPENEIMALRAESPEHYKALYKAEYGVECEL